MLPPDQLLSTGMDGGQLRPTSSRSRFDMNIETDPTRQRAMV